MKTLLVRLAGAMMLVLMALGTMSLTAGWRITLGILISLPSLGLLLISRRQLGLSFAVMPEAKTLVTKGLYSRIQHPMYLFLDLLLLGLIIVIDWQSLLLVWSIILLMQLIQSWREEKVLASVFGIEYETYKHNTWF